MILILGRGEFIEIMVIRENDGVEIHKRPMSWDLNQIKEWL